MCGRQQGIVNQIFGVPCKQCDKSENHKAPGEREREKERENPQRQRQKETPTQTQGTRRRWRLQCARMQVTHATINMHVQGGGGGVRKKEGGRGVPGIWRETAVCELKIYRPDK